MKRPLMQPQVLWTGLLVRTFRNKFLSLNRSMRTNCSRASAKGSSKDMFRPAQTASHSAVLRTAFPRKSMSGSDGGMNKDRSLIVFYGIGTVYLTHQNV